MTQSMKINEIFYSLEGEGVHTGYSTIFIRYSGCNLQCDWCDTFHTMFTRMSISQVFHELYKYDCKRVKITGGEPLLHDTQLYKLCKRLKHEGYYIAIETNGTLFVPEIFDIVDFICMDIKPPTSKQSSKQEVVNETFKRYKGKVEFKIPVFCKEDLLFAKQYNYLDDSLFLMMTDKYKDATKAMFLMPRTRIGIQLHKFLGVK